MFQYEELIHVSFLVGYVEERLWWPKQSPNKGKFSDANDISISDSGREAING